MSPFTDISSLPSSFTPLSDKTSTDAFHAEYEKSREKFADYVRNYERLQQERKTLKQFCEQAEIFYDAQYQDANIVVEVRPTSECSLNNTYFPLQAYKNFGDKVATLKKKLDSLIRDLPETVSPPSADNVPSPGNTPPDYRQTDMDLSDNEDNNNCKYLPSTRPLTRPCTCFVAKSPSDRPASNRPASPLLTASLGRHVRSLSSRLQLFEQRVLTRDIIASTATIAINPLNSTSTTPTNARTRTIPTCPH